MNASISLQPECVKNECNFLTRSGDMFVWTTCPRQTSWRQAGRPKWWLATYHGDKFSRSVWSHRDKTIVMPDSTLQPRCHACKTGHLRAVTRTQGFRPSGKQVTVELLASRCDQCGVESTRAEQHDENLRRLAARKKHYGGLLMGEEIVALRKRYGLTQQAASRIFGKGKIAFSRYEHEVTFPDASTTLMLTMAIEKPDSLKWLADKTGVEIPLWHERCEDALVAELKPVAAPAHRGRKPKVTA